MTGERGTRIDDGIIERPPAPMRRPSDRERRRGRRRSESSRNVGTGKGSGGDAADRVRVELRERDIGGRLWLGSSDGVPISIAVRRACVDLDAVNRGQKAR